MRPRSMAEIAQSLARIQQRDFEKAREEPVVGQRAPVGTNTRLPTIVKLLAAAVVVLMVAGLAAWFQMGQRKDDSAAVLEKFANKYAD